jgi:hypothetical protein
MDEGASAWFCQSQQMQLELRSGWSAHHSEAYSLEIHASFQHEGRVLVAVGFGFEIALEQGGGWRRNTTDKRCPSSAFQYPFLRSESEDKSQISRANQPIIFFSSF